MTMTLTYTQVKEIHRALDAAERQLKLLANASEWQKTWVITNNLQAIRLTLTPLRNN